MAATLTFGTAGIPLSTNGTGTLAGLERVKELGLGHLELEFVHGVKMGEITAREIKTTAEKLGISLSVHGPYYINLNAVEPEKQKASMERVYQSARVGDLCGAQAIVFHPAFMMGKPAEKVAHTVETTLGEVLERLKKEKISSELRPETTGKPTQWGSIDDLLALHGRVPALSPCIDFAHVHARENGRFQTPADVRKIFEKIENSDAKLLQGLHVHMSGIAFSPKGEKNHLTLDDPKNNFPWRAVLDCMKAFEVRATIVCEAPDIETGALLMKNYWERL